MPRVLLVEGHSPTRRICSRILRDHGYDVVEARNGRAALDLAQHHRLDAIVTDWLLPDGDGLQFLNQLRNRTPAPPVILFSSQPHLCPTAAIHRAGVKALIEKTENLAGLVSALGRDCPPANPAATC